MMQNCCGRDDILNRLTSSEVIYSELQQTFMKSKGKEDRNKLLKLVVSFVNAVSPVSEKVCVNRINNFRPICFINIWLYNLSRKMYTKIISLDGQKKSMKLC
jgi:hypothetical protein